jgi:hypothetical protein
MHVGVGNLRVVGGEVQLDGASPGHELVKAGLERRRYPAGPGLNLGQIGIDGDDWAEIEIGHAGGCGRFRASPFR